MLRNDTKRSENGWNLFLDFEKAAARVWPGDGVVISPQLQQPNTIVCQGHLRVIEKIADRSLRRVRGDDRGSLLSPRPVDEQRSPVIRLSTFAVDRESLRRSCDGVI